MNLADRMAAEEGFARKKGEKTDEVDKSIEPRKPENRYSIVKSDDEKMLAFGWANVSVRTDGDQIIDLQGDVLDADILENAAYRFVELYRSGGEMHENSGVAVLVESIVFTKEKMWAMGIPEGIVPEGWWIGFHVTDPEVWEKVKSGQYNMFSIEGEAIRREIPVEQVSKQPYTDNQEPALAAGF